MNYDTFSSSIAQQCKLEGDLMDLNQRYLSLGLNLVNIEGVHCFQQKEAGDL